jgi:hypothetical protein
MSIKLGLGTTFLVVAFVALLVYVIVPKAPISVVSTAQNGEFTQVGLANDQLVSPFYSAYVITPATLGSNGIYSGGSAVYSIATNSTLNPGTQLATIVVTISGPVGGMTLTPFPVFNNTVAPQSAFAPISVEVVSYPTGQVVYGPQSATYGEALNIPALQGGEYAIEVTTQNIKPITLAGPGIVKAYLFYLNGQLQSSATTATQFTNFYFIWQD